MKDSTGKPVPEDAPIPFVITEAGYALLAARRFRADAISRLICAAYSEIWLMAQGLREAHTSPSGEVDEAVSGEIERLEKLACDLAAAAEDACYGV